MKAIIRFLNPYSFQPKPYCTFQWRASTVATLCITPVYFLRVVRMSVGPKANEYTKDAHFLFPFKKMYSLGRCWYPAAQDNPLKEHRCDLYQNCCSLFERIPHSRIDRTRSNELMMSATETAHSPPRVPSADCIATQLAD